MGGGEDLALGLHEEPSAFAMSREELEVRYGQALNEAYEVGQELVAAERSRREAVEASARAHELIADTAAEIAALRAEAVLGARALARLTAGLRRLAAPWGMSLEDVSRVAQAALREAGQAVGLAAAASRRAAARRA